MTKHMTKKITENIHMANNNGEKMLKLIMKFWKSILTKTWQTLKSLTLASIIKEIERSPFSQTTDVGTTFLVSQVNHKLLNVHTFWPNNFFLRNLYCKSIFKHVQKCIQEYSLYSHLILQKKPLNIHK